MDKIIPYVEVLSTHQLDRIHDGSMKLLEETGIVMKDKESRHILSEKGAKVIGERVLIPSSLIEWGIKKAPSSFLLYNREGEEVMELGGDESYFGTGPTTPYILDPFTSQRKKVTSEDVRRMVHLVQALENIDFVMSMGLISDSPSGTEDLYEFRELLLGTSKPLCGWGYNWRSYEIIRDMALVFRDSLSHLQERPFYVLYSEPTTPLLQTEDALAKVIFMAKNSLPFVHTSGAAAGGVAPVTLAGLMVVSTAEVLSGILLSQIINEGTPCLFGYGTHIMDMKTAICSYGAPEKALGQAATTQQARYYEIPSWGYAGCSDAKIVDGQLALESTMHDLMSILAGANFIHDVGFMESGLTSSPSSLVLNNEIIGMVRRIRKGIDTSDCALALDVIMEIGPQGNFLTHPHTLNHFKDTWYPEMLDRQNFQNWQERGSKSLEERLEERTRKLLEYQPPPISQEKIEELNRVFYEGVNKLREKGD